MSLPALYAAGAGICKSRWVSGEEWLLNGWIWIGEVQSRKCGLCYCQERADLQGDRQTEKKGITTIAINTFYGPIDIPPQRFHPGFQVMQASYSRLSAGSVYVALSKSGKPRNIGH